MKKKFVFILTAIMLCLAFALSACGGTGGGNNDTNHGDDTYYTVTFDSQGGSAVESQSVLAGNPVPAPNSPTRENFSFNGWYLSASEDAKLWNFATDRVNADMTLYAHWTQNEAPIPTMTLTFSRNAAGTGYLVTGDSGQAANIVIPATHEDLPVVGIADSAFAYSKHTSDILSVTVPDSVTEIGKNAFHNQDALVSVNIGEESGLQKIGNNAFSGNSALSSIYLPAGLSKLGDSVFNNCGALDTITVASENTHYSGEGNCLIDLETKTLLRGSNKSAIPETVQKIGVAAFRKATLTALTIPKTVIYIDKYAFLDSSIVTINYEGTEEAWEKAVSDENGKERMWKSSKQDITVHCSDTIETTQILVAYFSATGTTKGVAEKIANVTGGTLFEIEPSRPYTAADLDYDSDCRANREQNDETARPQIESSFLDMGTFDVVYLGYPIWWGKAPKIIYTFLESYDFSGKTIVPFCTSGSSPISGSIPDLKEIAGGATWLSGRRFSSSASQSDVEDWVNSLNANNK